MDLRDFRVTLVCAGRVHLFDLARQLLRMDLLERIFTGYPRWKLKDEEIPKARLSTFPWLQTPYMALGKLGLSGWLDRELAWRAHETLDRFALNNLPKTDLLFALSGSGLYCGQEAQSRGARYVCDRGSSHIRYQDAMLREEFARWGQTFPGIDKRMIAKELAEYEAADLVSVPSNFAYRSFLKMGFPERRLRRVPYGVDLHRFERTSDPAPDRFEVLFVGQISFRKGVPYLLDAFRRFDHPKKRLRLVGSVRPEMERFLREFPPSEDVELLGHVPQLELKYIMSESNVMVLPSIEEGLALVQAQALACGCPVIGTYHTGAEDLYSNGKEGFIVPIRDAQAISEKLQILADDTELQRNMGEAALQRVRELGGWDQYGETMTDLMAGLVNGHS